MMSKRKSISVLAAVVAGLTYAGLTAGDAGAATTLRQLADAKGKDIGFALTSSYLNEAQYKTIADNEFNLVVAENAMKWDATEPTQGTFSFASGDAVATYAASSSKKLYGHTLVWHSQLPGWVSSLDATALGTAMTNHINGVAGHFKGKVAAWDVVNEAFNDDGTRRASVFQQKLGDGYIATALKAARAADPAAKLCLNDYNIDGVNAKSTAYYNLVSSLKSQGVPIDCVGFQAHLIVGSIPGDIQANLQRFADLGVDVRITELDIRMQTPSDATKLATQAANYKTVVSACLAVTRCQGVTVWGITDKYSWIPSVFAGQGAALLYDENYAAKPAYTAVAQAFGGTTATTAPTTPATPTSPATTAPSSPATTGPTSPATVSPSSPAPAGKACSAVYSVSSTWGGGFVGSVKVTAGSAAIGGWTVTWNWPGSQSFATSWNAAVTTTGSSITAKNAAYNGSLAAGGSTTWGFQANGDSASAPTVTCTAS